MKAGTLVILHLTQPTEKFWGVLQRLGAEGIIVRGINLSSFDDWARIVGRGEATLDLATMFVPMFRVERMFVDEQVGEVESYGQRFERMAGVSIASHLGLDGEGDGVAGGGLVS